MSDSVLRLSASLFPKYDDFLAHLLDQITSAEHDLHLVYLDVNETWAHDTWDVLEQGEEERSLRKTYNSVTHTFWVKIMPNFLHDCIQVWNRDVMISWMGHGMISLDELKYLRPFVGTTLGFDSGPYRGSRKDPDLFVLPGAQVLPPIVMQSGWEESLPEMQNDKDLLLIGGEGEIQVVFIARWRIHADGVHVSGILEVYVIFPRPLDGTGQNDVVKVTRRQLFGRNSVDNHDPNDIFEYSLEGLRRLATMFMARMELAPAEEF
ncbi:hypothetical protein P170DRAFT_412890 [Aspergillus steynii IBT 23096]|uniref:Uncharacterized protein n=1 Tax=Aspergillus steynii IBT 23096 TaxID=1392250 RepID=A0A2I2G2T7_9EURO|nr:uncharacterized protein P170DRAFT_412890 [Aspergillus steynii IBT 23096]PLB47188.1 hypothetical protein P170DRAFT_412890 [Aspergillus steynii IBT 23096]